MKKSSKAAPISFKKRAAKPFQKASAGMRVEGPSHEEEGIEAQTPDGKPVAEIEGGERIFSQEDTNHMEQEAKAIVAASKTSPQQAQKLAMALGFEVVKMLMRQEKNQNEEQGQDSPSEDDAMGAINSFGNSEDDDSSYSTIPD